MFDEEVSLAKTHEILLQYLSDISSLEWDTRRRNSGAS